MAVWSPAERSLDWDLVSGGAVTKFLNPGVLSETTEWLSSHGYRVVRLDAGRWKTVEAMHSDIATSLDFPDYYGKNLDAFNDSLQHFMSQQYEEVEADVGLVLVIHRFDEIYAFDKHEAHGVLDIFADVARVNALLGHRMMCLVQSSDPWFEIDDVGGTSPGWNRREWLDRNRVG